MNVEDYLSSEEISFYERGIPKFAGLIGTSMPGLKDYLHKNPVVFFKKAAKYIAKNPNTKYSLEGAIDKSKISRGGVRKLKRVLLELGAQDENIAEPILKLAKEQRFQEIYLSMFVK